MVSPRYLRIIGLHAFHRSRASTLALPHGGSEVVSIFTVSRNHCNNQNVISDRLGFYGTEKPLQTKSILSLGFYSTEQLLCRAYHLSSDSTRLDFHGTERPLRDLVTSLFYGIEQPLRQHVHVSVLRHRVAIATITVGSAALSQFIRYRETIVARTLPLDFTASSSHEYLSYQLPV